jgi:hypothetical protein
VGRDSYALYLCRRQTGTGEQIRCQSVAGSGVNAFVEERLLDAIRPAGIEAAIAAIGALERRAEDLRRQWQHRIEQAEYEAGLARRRYEAVDPDNRLVAGNLERDWEESCARSKRSRRSLRSVPARLLCESTTRSGVGFTNSRQIYPGCGVPGPRNGRTASGSCASWSERCGSPSTTSRA